MHEEAMLRDLRGKIQEVAAREGASHVVRVSLWIGALSHVTPDQLRRRWPSTVDGTAAEGSSLSIETSTDATDPRAQGIVLTSLDVEEAS